MDEKRTGYISIGEMAKMNRTTVPTLRLYDSMNLLTPCYVDEKTCYRYYDIKQNARLDMIQYMKELGMELKEIKSILDRKDLDLIEFISCNGLFEALPIRFAKDYKNEPKITRDCIDKKDLASIRNWHSRVYDHLDSYVLLTDENIKNRVLRYLLLNKRVEEINYNKYQLIYEGSF